MVKSYCIKQKKETECVKPSGYKQTKNGRLMFFCTCRMSPHKLGAC